MNFSKEEKAMWLEDWQKSGKKAWTYARENGLVPQTFVSWEKKRTKAKSDFIEIKPKPTIIPSTTMMLIEKEDIKIHLPLGINSSELETVIRSLKAAV